MDILLNSLKFTLGHLGISFSQSTEQKPKSHWLGAAFGGHQVSRTLASKKDSFVLKDAPALPFHLPVPYTRLICSTPFPFTAESLVSTHKHCLLHVLHSPSLSSSFGTLDIDLDTLIILTYLFSPLVCQLLKESPVLNHLVYYCKLCSILGGR